MTGTPMPSSMVTGPDIQKSWTWAQGVGSGKACHDGAFAAARDGNGFVYAGGVARDLFLERRALDGSITWTTTLPGDANLEAHGVAVGAGTIHVVGTVAGSQPEVSSQDKLDGFHARYDAGGALISIRTMGGDGNQTTDAVAAVGTGAVVAGSFSGTLAMAPVKVTAKGKRDAYVMAIDSDGNPDWVIVIGGPGDDVATGVVVGGGSVWVTGWHSEGAVYLGKEDVPFASHGPGNVDIFVARLDLAKGFLKDHWETGGPGDDRARAIALAGSGVNTSLIVAGEFEDTVDFALDPPDALAMTSDGLADMFVARYTDLDGTVKAASAKRRGGNLHDAALALYADDKVVAVTGYQSGPQDFDVLLWHQPFVPNQETSSKAGGPGREAGRGVVGFSSASLGEQYAVVGTFEDSIDFTTPLLVGGDLPPPDLELTSSGRRDLFVAHFRLSLPFLGPPG